MNFQEKVLEVAAGCAPAALPPRRSNERAAQRAASLQDRSHSRWRPSFNKVARRHAARFVKENSTIACRRPQGRLALARDTFATLTQSPRARRSKSADPTAARKRARQSCLTIPPSRVMQAPRHPARPAHGARCSFA